MTGLVFQDVSPGTQPLLEAALEQLSADLGDEHRIAPEVLSAALFGPYPSCHAVLALDSDERLFGAAMFSPVVSTTTGGAGAYVSDLWVAEEARGQSLGKQLLAQVGRRATDLWQARFLRLASYASNPRAEEFYNRLGFRAKTDEYVLQLAPDAFDQLDG